MMMTQLIAQAGDAGGVMTIGAGVITAIGIAAAGIVTAFRKGQASPRQAVTLQEPVPEVPVKRVYSPPTYYQHHALEKRVERVEGAVDQLRRDQAEQYRMLMNAGEERKDKIFEKMDGIARGWHQRMDVLMKLQGIPNSDHHE